MRCCASKGSRGYPIRVLAFHENDDVVRLDELDLEAVDLHSPGTMAADVASRARYGFSRSVKDLAGYEAALGERPVRLAGFFRLGVDFANDGNLLMTAANFAHFFPRRAPGRDPLSMVDLGVVKLEDDADPLAVQETLRDALPSDVEVLTKDELIEREMKFWREMRRWAIFFWSESTWVSSWASSSATRSSTPTSRIT